MGKYATFHRRPIHFLAIAILIAGVMAPVLLRESPVDAKQITSRSITMSSSKAGATATTYRVKWTAAQSIAIAGIVVDFCSNSPLVGLACTAASGVTVPEIGASPSVTLNGGITATWNPTTNVSAPHHTLMLAKSAGTDTMTAGTTVVDFTITGVTNPTGAATGFYARILTYTTGAGATGYAPTTEGAYTDNGGAALSTANQLTVNARVQEQLKFCVAGTTVNSAAGTMGNCTATLTGSAGCSNTVDLGVVDSTHTNVSPVNPATYGSGNNCNGAAMVQTNASNGVSVTYFAESDATTNHSRGLKIQADNTCGAGTSATDKCFNTVAAKATITAGTEAFGMGVATINGQATAAYTCAFDGAGGCSLTRATPYNNGNGGGTTTYTTDTGQVAATTNGYYQWDETGTAAQLASSTSVVDNEALILKYATTPAITTPTGTYAVTSTYIATATF